MTITCLLHQCPMERLLLRPPSGTSLPPTAARLSLLLRRFACYIVWMVTSLYVAIVMERSPRYARLNAHALCTIHTIYKYATDMQGPTAASLQDKRHGKRFYFGVASVGGSTANNHQQTSDSLFRWLAGSFLLCVFCHLRGALIAYLGRCSDSIGSACIAAGRHSQNRVLVMQRPGENQNHVQQGPPGDVNHGAALRRPRCKTLFAVVCCVLRRVVFHHGYAISHTVRL
jgi:hypothetical protein